MKENWINPDLCSFDEKTRIELGPQFIKLKATVENLKQTVTAPHYQVGRKDAVGKVIALNEEMTCVDWRCKHLPKIWKVYQWKAAPGENDIQKYDELLDLKEGGQELNEKQSKFIANCFKFVKVQEFAAKQEAIDFAKNLAGEM